MRIMANTVLPIGDLTFRLVFAYSIGFLDFADELFSMTVDCREVIIRQLSPTLPHRTLQLLPIAFYTISILFNFLNQPETWFASLVEPHTQQRRMAFPKTNNGDSLPVHTAYELLGFAHGSFA